MSYDPSIFRAYDVRGLYKTEFDEDFAFELGNKLASILKAGTVVVGRDPRLSSPTLTQAIIGGLKKAGVQVIDLGIVTTPLFYYSAKRAEADGGVMVTASHNGKEYNGFKVVGRNAIEIEGLLLKEYFDSADFTLKEGGIVEQKSYLDEYIKENISRAKLPASCRTKVLIDTGNGAGGIVAEKIVESLGLNCVPLFFERDGNFPHCSPNPLDIEFQDLASKKILETRADFGVLFDGDADRVIFMDSEGKMIPCDYILILLAQTFKNPAIVYDLRMSKSVPESIEAFAGESFQTRTGRTFVKQKMRQHNADVGGELSGHFPLKEMNYNEAAFLTFLKILKIVEESGLKLDQLIDPLKKYHHSGEINFKGKFEKVELISQISKLFSDGRQSFLDGITIEYGNWWLNIRPSNTEPLLRLVIEADTKQILDSKREKLTKLLSDLLK